jgi:adenosylcobinamide-GDP ribazoletransferase
VIRREWLLLRVALQFLTRLPLRLPGWDEAWLNACVRHFPLVGALIGACCGAVLWACAQVWPPMVAAGLALAAGALLTGAFHEDGLADSFDALGGAVSRERALEIMKDSRIGSYGALALLLVTGLRWALLAQLCAGSPEAAALALVAVHALARLAPVAVMVALPYAGTPEHAKAKPLAQQVPRAQLGWALLACLPALALMARPLLLLAVAALSALLMGAWLRRRLGGYTGDGLGATEQIAELMLLLCLAS